MALLVERSLPTLEIRGSNLTISELTSIEMHLSANRIEMTQIHKKRLETDVHATTLKTL